MSRHSIFTNGLEFAYGYDRPLRQYFYQVFDEANGFPVEQSDIVDGSTRNEVVEAAKRIGAFDKIPQHHISALMLDLPIPD